MLTSFQRGLYLAWGKEHLPVEVQRLIQAGCLQEALALLKEKYGYAHLEDEQQAEEGLRKGLTQEVAYLV